MPSETAKEHVPVIDLLVTESQKDMRNLHDAVSPRGRSNEETCHSAAEEQLHSCERVGTSCEMKKDKLNNTRYFVIKSLNHQNIQMSIKKGIWATQVMNEPILEEAFQNSGKVILIFSVNMSGFFQGYAQMMSSVGWRRDNIWSQGGGKNNPWGRSFKVKWLRLHDLPFQKTLHMKNPWNEFKPVKISRDCQELPGDIGAALCELLDEGNDMNTNLFRDEISGDGFSARGPYIEPFHSVQDEDFNVPPMHMSPLLYSSLLYHHQAEASRFQLPYQRADVILNNISNGPESSKVKQSRHSQINGSSANKINSSSTVDSWGVSADGSTLIGNFTEDDILEMTYEEYLEAHTQASRRLHLTVYSLAEVKPRLDLDLEVLENCILQENIYFFECRIVEDLDKQINHLGRSSLIECGTTDICSTMPLLHSTAYCRRLRLDMRGEMISMLISQAAGRSTSWQKSSSSKERSDDSQSASSSKKRTYHQSSLE